MNKDKCIGILRAALQNILDQKTGPGIDFPEVYGDMKWIAKEALDKTKNVGTDSVIDLIDKVVSVVDSDADWEHKFDRCSHIYNREISPLIQDLGLSLEWYDPDTSYEEDTRALVDALEALKRNLQQEEL